MNNSFTGLRRKVGNRACRALVNELMAYREQICLRGEWNQASGWDDAFNSWMAEELGRVRKSVAYVTTEKSSEDQDALNEQRSKEAADENQTLLDRYTNGNPITTDDILMPSNVDTNNELPFDFSGADPRIPQVHGRKNQILVTYVGELDRTIAEITNLDCQATGTTIPATQSRMVVALLDSLYTILQSKGGEKNRRTIAQGTTAVEAKRDDVVGPEIADAGN